MARRGLKVQWSVDRDLCNWEVVSVKRLCTLCGDYKDEAFDVCWDPDVRCNREAPDAPYGP